MPGSDRLVSVAFFSKLIVMPNVGATPRGCPTAKTRHVKVGSPPAIVRNAPHRVRCRTLPCIAPQCPHCPALPALPRIALHCPALPALPRIARIAAHCPATTIMAIIAIVAWQCRAMRAPTRGAPTIVAGPWAAMPVLHRNVCIALPCTSMIFDAGDNDGRRYALPACHFPTMSSDIDAILRS